ncbi:hypothetical protein [Azonexus sp.]|uniref:hypothetical protein n=1 Tax=Azonexus sp. TaxID=1872668 RepID=UPI0035AFB838
MDKKPTFHTRCATFLVTRKGLKPLAKKVKECAPVSPRCIISIEINSSSARTNHSKDGA